MAHGPTRAQVRPGVLESYAALVAAIGWFALVLQLVLLARDRDGTVAGFLGAVWTLLRYYTVLTNILVAVALTNIALGAPEHPSLATAA